MKRRFWFLFLLREWLRWVEMKVGFLISDFHALETEVKMIMDLMGRKTKILVRISSGKDPHGIILLVVLLSDIAASPKRETRV